MRTKQALLLLAAQLLAVSVVSAECAHGSITTAGSATQTTAPDMLTLTFQIEIESSSFAGAKAAGDALREQLLGLQPRIPQGAVMAVGYDFGILRQKRLAWTGGKKLQYEFVVIISGIPDGAAQGALVAAVDGALELDSKLIVQEVDASLSRDASQHVRSRLLSNAVENARTNATAIAQPAGLQIGRVSSVAMAGASPGASFGANLDLPILGRSYETTLVFHKRFSVDAGVPDIELTEAVVATFCAEPS